MSNQKEQVIQLLSRNMKELRESHNITQEELSEKSGLHRNYISDAERGVRNISLKSLEKIAEGLDVEIADLLKK